MAAAVAIGSTPLSSSLSVQEKGSRNKRKFRADSPLPDLHKLVGPQIDHITYELPPEKPSGKSNLENHPRLCDLCNIAVGHPREEMGMEELQEVDWDGPAEAKLENLLLKHLDSIFKTAIRKIVSHGFTKEVATKAIMRTGLCYGDKDTVSNIVDNTLKLLKNEPGDLQQLQKYVLAEMICVLMEVRPFLSIGNAMWCLLLCDINVSHACEIENDPLNSFCSDDSRDDRSDIQSKPDANVSSAAGLSVADFSTSEPEKTNPVLSSPQHVPQAELPTVSGIPNLPAGRFSASRNVQVLASSDPSAEESNTSSESQPVPSKEKCVVGKKGHGGTSKRESILRQKPIHFEKSYRGYGSKGSLRTTKLGTQGNFVFDRKGTTVSASNGASLNNTSMKLSEGVGRDVSRADNSSNLCFSTRISGSSSGPNSLKSPSSLSTFNTELSLSLTPTRSDGVNHKLNSCSEAESCSSFHGVPSDKRCEQWVPEDKRDETLLKFVSRARALQAQLQEWTEWAQQRVMQTAHRLNKDKAELQSLRREKEEVIRLRKERKSLEESSLKRLAELENALIKAGHQVNRTNASVQKLRGENVKLRYDVEAAKLHAAESAASCQQVSNREVKRNKQFQSWDRERASLQGEFLAEKHKLTQVQQQVTRAKEDLDQLESGCRARERELLEASAKSEEEAMKAEAEDNLRGYKDEIRRLEAEIARLRLTAADPPRSWRRRRGGTPAEEEEEEEEEEGEEEEEVRRERECVMCLCEEMSVVFLPCAHQVVCAKCNELHEKQGMRDCPSCRAPIQQRIRVRYRDS
ncbi:unnamed protein product [Spirodela intermedia]|uniref:RING-type domain-containing protein n=1 Tax=Spirodela intermedia TaxID=51605 RepID=A0A7I8IZU1_SPIIN|nr:unnamed protein product [Spirodela intermedia]CAA6663495.1 unnamed protein product [Spirodela intermedia]